MDNLGHRFIQKLYSFDPNSNALITEEKTYTYGDLLLSMQDFEKKLSSIPKGSCIGILGDFSLENIALFLACVQSQMILIPLSQDPTLPMKLQEGQVDYICQNHIFQAQNPSGKHPLILNLKASHSSGLILFSSGSTGKPKAILHHLDNLLAPYLSKKPKSICMLLFLLFDHIGGINTMLQSLAIGGCAFIPKDRKNVDGIAQAICEYQISILPASPSFLNLFLLNQCHKKYDLSSLKLITYGTEIMPDSLLKRLKIALPKVRFHQTFGASEIGITQTKSKENFIALNDPNLEYKIINNELWLKSKTQTLGYLNADNCVFQDGWFCTGDKVETMIENGEEYLKIIGRTQEIINVGGEKVFPQEIENIITQIEGIQDCLVYGEPHILTGQSISVALVVDTHKLNPNDKLGLKKLIRDYCKNYLPNYKIPTKVVIQEHLNMSERFKKIRLKTEGGGA
ncbi:fatty acid--CoA ligase family protein [Helicobacter sp. 11S03491-1]|uniref:class I adenylate-forming enzyme family protein n=1 Tax=Helicobacter sp. 11S03491-1 TaxID=1476196 RepID=UPI000BA65E0F|nr:fatty acid--CoA ligase family protein [Helicobacter sp. 11S03491-1]PAF43784.1 AMP-dependent synthetase [Helicobacter sp. 11S03491-1]